VRRITFYAALVAFSWLLLGAAPAAKSPPVREDVQGFVRTFVEATNRADVTAVMEMYSKKAGIASIGDGEITRGWDAIRTESDQIVGKEGAYKISLGSVDVMSIGTGNAIAFAPYAVTLTTDQGPMQLSGAITLVLEKTAGAWKIVHEHTSIRAAQE
jgi:ketosteroid isomerase-like protein